MSKLIRLLKKIRKTNKLQKKSSTAYAFVGIGNHSIHNLYPVLDYLNLHIKYIITKTKTSAKLVNENLSHGVIGTTDFDLALNDKEIKGIFISADPSDHFKLVKKALEHNKHVFVEKPPCTTIDQLKILIDLQQTKKKYCVTGFQKRYSESISILKNKLKNEKIISYNYRFVTGAYPEGDPFFELFLHPVDLVNFLFGKSKIVSVLKAVETKGLASAFIQFRHKNIIGTLEASTEYTWSMPEEKLTVNTSKGIYTLKNHQTLTFLPKAGLLLSIPKEKLFPSVPELHYLYHANSFLPIFSNNQLVSQGYFNEIHTFINLCENRNTKNLSDLADIQHSLELIVQIRKK